MNSGKPFFTKEQTFSFELFPPKTAEGFDKLLHTIRQLCKLNPDFFSCTYGAGGGSREKTLDIVELIQKEHGIPAVAHLTCVLHTKAEIQAILKSMKNRSITNVLALRGDAPKDNPNWTPGEDNFKYSSELVAFIRKNHGKDFNIGVAGFPEGHPLCPSRELDRHYLQNKINAGADFVITQLFFNNQEYFNYVELLRQLGVTQRIIPGVLPITDYNGLVRFCASCGASIPQLVHEIFQPLADNPQATLEVGASFCVKQCRQLLEGGAPGLHFYCLNKTSPVDMILKQIRK
jgi:methylenetetrahydrofolate reductase (NADPH)